MSPLPRNRSTVMKSLVLALGFSFIALSFGPAADTKRPVAIPNSAIDMEGYLQVSREAAEHRQTRRLSEEDFLRMSREPGTIVLDARSKAKYDLLHIKGAIHLNFSDITV